MKKKYFFVISAVVFLFPFPTKAGDCDGVISRMFGGEKTSRKEWPWNVAFIHRPSEKFFCGGSLISDRHVLSGEFLDLKHCL